MRPRVGECDTSRVFPDAEVRPMSWSPELAAATVLSPEGEAVPLAALVAEQPTVVLFLRHFG
ncbi:MAG: hypothetical protein R3F60_11955 [bacterium]